MPSSCDTWQGSRTWHLIIILLSLFALLHLEVGYRVLICVLGRRLVAPGRHLIDALPVRWEIVDAPSLSPR